MDGMNDHLKIEFKDKMIWPLEIRRFNAKSPPPALRDYLFVELKDLPLTTWGVLIHLVLAILEHFACEFTTDHAC